MGEIIKYDAIEQTCDGVQLSLRAFRREDNTITAFLNGNRFDGVMAEKKNGVKYFQVGCFEYTPGD